MKELDGKGVIFAFPVAVENGTTQRVKGPAGVLLCFGASTAARTCQKMADQSRFCFCGAEGDESVNDTVTGLESSYFINSIDCIKFPVETKRLVCLKKDCISAKLLHFNKIMQLENTGNL